MNSAKYVDEQIKILKTKGIPLQDAAWEAAKLCIGFPYIFGTGGSTVRRRSGERSTMPTRIRKDWSANARR